MAQQKYIFDMQDTVFPLLSTQQTRTIMGATVGRAPAATAKPGVAYMHNVMPTRYGMDSVGYIDKVPNIGGVAGNASPSDIRVVFGDTGDRYYVAFTARGDFYRMNDTHTGWQQITGNLTFNPFEKDSLTTAVVNGISYLFYRKTHMYKLITSTSTSTLPNVTPIGLSVSDVIGIVASSGYLIAYTEDAIAWSSTINPLDFAPSQITGAGGGKVAGADGPILFATSNSVGILLFTANNVIAGTYTGNAVYPFKFREVANSKGGVNLDTVAWEANSESQYVYSKSGLMAINSQKAQLVLPEITDFISGRVFEDFNTTSKLLETTVIALDAQLIKKIKYIDSRYLIVSYGLPSTDNVFTHALVVDTSMNKVGKLRIAHKDIFEYIGVGDQRETQNIGFLDTLGKVSIVDFEAFFTGEGVLVMGKLQATLTRLIGLMGVQVENVRTGAALDLFSSASFDGKNFVNNAGYLAMSANNVRDFSFRSSALTHNITLIGDFSLVTMEISYRVEGRR